MAAAAERGFIRPNQGGTAVHTVLEQICSGAFFIGLQIVDCKLQIGLG